MRINASETKHHLKRVEYFGKEAFEANKKLVDEKSVWLECDVQERDKYGRLLACISISNRFIETRDSNGYHLEIVATHIYTGILENNRWCLCDYKMEYHSGFKALSNLLFAYGG